jgi:hypothetical protein
MNDTKTLEILDALKTLPSEKIAEVRDFAVFLRERYGRSEIIDESDEWTEEDLRDFSLASFRYFEESERGDEAAK